MSILNSSSSDITTSTRSRLVAPRSSSRVAASTMRSLATWNCSAMTRLTRSRRSSMIASCLFEVTGLWTVRCMARAMRWRTALILAFDVETAALTGGEELPGPHVGRQVLDAAKPRVVPVVLLIGRRPILDRLDGLDGQAEPGGHGLA